ncbi:MAG TPA: non-canonical purine NTP pyrophosphatase [Patescibacteria group bacterium]|nr:non-canonical purine NTP pyrophosphatase [Patescibacteria group bacterium]
MKLLIATTNPGKLAEIKRFLSDIPIELVSLADVGITDSVEETGKTFEENAILKAKHYARESGLPTLADDGGFEIDALGGEPGVKSHRWVHGDRENTDEELITYAFKRMKGVPKEKRGAQLRLVLALVKPDGDVVATSEEKIRGIVAATPSKTHHPGFPYRAILFIPEMNKYYDQTVMSPEENDKYNHRKKAVEKLKPIIRLLI